MAEGKQKRGGPFSDFSLFVAHRFNNVPIPLTELVGRKPEIEKARSLLARTSLLTLTGAGGSGKTRLALALAGEVAEEYPDGVCWVDLAGLLDGSLLWSAAAQPLGLQETPGQSCERVLSNYLAFGHWLLILDNCEHLIYACAQFAEQLLSTCPHLKLICTSREPLGITGEVVWSVPVLSMPEPPFTPGRLVQSDAPRLFIARASAINPDFVLTEDNAEAVAQICQRLDGMPLALELAAARVRVLSVEQIAARLGDRFELLTVGSRMARPRHQTLRSTIDWSFDLLTEAERVLFRRLAVFPASFSIEAAEYVCADPGAPAQVSSRKVVDLVAHLVDKSLVLVHPGRTTRYGMLETIRQYALEKLEQTDEPAEVSQRHFRYFMILAEQAEPKLISAEQIAALAELDAEHDHLAAALEWAVASDHPGQALRLASSLWRVWHMRGRPTEGRIWLEKALTGTEALGRNAERARGLQALGCLTWLEGDLALARKELEEAVTIAGELGERLLLADAQRWLAFVIADQGHPDQAVELVERSGKVFEAAGDRWNFAHSIFLLGRLHMDLGHLDQATSLYESSLQLFRELGDRWGIALPIGHLGVIAERMGDTETARRLLEERLRLAKETGSRQQMVFALAWLGMMAFHTGQYREAELRLRECLELAWQAGFRVSSAESLEALGWVARANHQAARAARLMGAAGALLSKATPDPPSMADHERELSALRAEMSAEDFEAAWAEGQAMNWERAMAYARQVVAAPPEPRLTSRQAGKAAFGGLSAREREVAKLIAEGKSNRQIAEALVVSERTATTHVANILSKLGFNSRVQVAAWAVQNRLLEKQSDG